MKQHRKCDQTKFKKRKAKQYENHLEKLRYQKDLDRKLYLKHEKNRAEVEAMEKFTREWKKLDQRLVNILAKRLCQLSPEYEKELIGKEAMQNIRGIFGVLKQWSPELFMTRVISEEPFMAIPNKEDLK